MVRTIISFLLILFSTYLIGQDTSYIQEPIQFRTVALHSTMKLFRQSFSSAATESIVLQNNNLGMGMRLRYKKIGLAFSVPIATFNRSGLGDPKAFGVGFNLFPGKLFLQGTYHQIRGFDNNDVDADIDNPARFPNSKMYFVRLIGNYAFNQEKFSLSAAFKMINIQRRSAGSWILSVPISYQLFITDSLTLPTVAEADFQFDQYQNIKLGLGGGYAYTQVWDYWSTTIFVVGGAEFRRITFEAVDADQPRSDFLMSPRVRFVGSVLYNSPTFFCGLVGHYLPGIDVADGINSRFQNIRFRLICGKRF